ncbi:HlyD family efflux transporter periplasmic adaptor subunit [Sedimenticola sp.]|uniref:HlyD family efflux transporter periplasmic adaptor subunit n=1 Tax=Sedimenticola sp. TaxID=1940285 RepID=UPI003D09BEA8
MKKSLLVVPLIAALAVAGWYGWTKIRAPAPADGLHLYGNIEVRLVNLAFNASGRILEMRVAEGARVEPGQPLARLETNRLQALRDAAAARVEAQRQQVNALLAGSRPEEIDKLRAELLEARAQSLNARRSRQRQQDLAQKGLASPQDLDNAETVAEAAAAKVQAVQAALDLATAGPRAEDVAAAKATLSALQADLTLAERNLSEAVLASPAAGVIQSRILEPGDMASPQRPVYTLALTEPLWARVYVDGPNLGKIRQGMPAQVSSDSFPGKRYPGWIGYISPSAEFTPKQVQTEEVRADLVYQIHVFVCNPQEELRLGMPVTVTLDLEQPSLTTPGCGQ